LQTARQHSDQIAKLFAGHNGIIGSLTEDLIDTSSESESAIAALKHTPGAAFGSCRYKLGSISEHRAEYERLVEGFEAHDIGYVVIREHVAERGDTTIEELRAWLLATHQVAAERRADLAYIEAAWADTQKSRCGLPSKIGRTSPRPVRHGVKASQPLIRAGRSSSMRPGPRPT
jgi:hypothetical protein